MQHHEQYFNQMVETMQQFYEITPAFIIRLRSLVYFIDHIAGEMILHPKDIQRCAWFQVSGISAELFKASGKSGTLTSWFWFANDFIYTSPGFFSQRPTESSIEVIADSHFICISFNDFNILMAEFPEIKQLTENLRDKSKKQRAAHRLSLSENALMRVKRMYRERPEIFESDCSKVRLASFLQMAPDTLTRAMKTLGIYYSRH